MNLLRAISNLFRFDRTNWKALTLCFLAAAIFWLFSAFNKEHTTNLHFPIAFEFDSRHYVAVDPLPAALTLNVTGIGWELVRKSLGFKVPQITMSLERPTDTKKIVAASLMPLVASQVGSLQLNYIVNDTLRLKIEPRLSRKIKLLADLQHVSFKKNFGRVGPVRISPDSVALDGPKSFVEQLPDTIFLSARGARIAGKFNETIEVVIPNAGYINRNPPVADVTFDVEPVEESIQAIKLKLPKMPWGTEIGSDSVLCTFVIPQRERDHFQSDALLLSAAFSLPDIRKGETKYFLPVVAGVPDYASLVHIDSVKVKRY